MYFLGERVIAYVSKIYQNDQPRIEPNRYPEKGSRCPTEKYILVKLIFC